MSAPALGPGALTAVADDLARHAPWWPGLDQTVLDVHDVHAGLLWIFAHACS